MMLVVPVDTTQKVADHLVEASVMAILNYAHINLNVPQGVYFKTNAQQLLFSASRVVCQRRG